MWYDISARSEIFMVLKIQFEVFWVVMLWRVAVGYQLFEGPCCLHHKGEVNGTGKEGMGIGRK
jgi:hypothetical protein